MLACGPDPPGLTSATLIVKGWDSTAYGGFAAPTRLVLLRAPSVLPATLISFFILFVHNIVMLNLSLASALHTRDSGRYCSGAVAGPWAPHHEELELSPLSPQSPKCPRRITVMSVKDSVVDPCREKWG